MFDSIILIAIGCTIGWNMPQPAYAKWIQSWVMNKIRNFSNKSK